MSEDNGWDGMVTVMPPPRAGVAASEVERLLVVVDQFEAAGDAERRRLLAYLVDRYGQPQPVRGRRG